MVAKPVVVSETLRDVEVMEATAPLACVVMMTVTIDLVDVETWADVIVVLDVLEVADSDAAADDVFDVSEASPVEVVDEVSVVGTTTVVGVLFEVVVTDVSVVRVVTEVEVMVAVGVVVDAVTTDVVAALDDDAEAPVPNVCLLWNIPFIIGMSTAAVEVEIRVRTAKAPWAERSILL